MNNLTSWLIAIIAQPIIFICICLVVIWGRYLLQEIHHEYMKIKRKAKTFCMYHGWW